MASSRVSLISKIPDNLIEESFGFLSLEGLGRVSCVNKLWQKLVAHTENILWRSVQMKHVFPQLRTIDRTTWETHVKCEEYGLDPTGAPEIFPSKAALKTTVVRLRALFLRIEDDAGVTDFTLPKGLSLNKIIAFSRDLKKGNPVVFKNMDHDVLDDLGNMSLDKTMRVFITRGVLNGTRMHSDESQEFRVQHCWAERRPQPFEAAALIAMTYIISQVRLCPDKPEKTYMRWSYRLEGMPSTFVSACGIGNFSKDGLELCKIIFSAKSQGAGGLLPFPLK